MIEVTPSGGSCGAEVRGVDLSRPLSDSEIDEIHAAWLDHHVLAFPDQKLDDDQLEAFCQQFGRFGEDPYFNPIPGRTHIAAVKREADETNPIFAEHWHSDWSFLAQPPKGTVLYSLDIPPVGGDTCFANMQAAFEALSAPVQELLENLRGVNDLSMTLASAIDSSMGLLGDDYPGLFPVGDTRALTELLARDPPPPPTPQEFHCRPALRKPFRRIRDKRIRLPR